MGLAKEMKSCTTAHVSQLPKENFARFGSARMLAINASRTRLREGQLPQTGSRQAGRHQLGTFLYQDCSTKCAKVAEKRCAQKRLCSVNSMCMHHFQHWRLLFPCSHGKEKKTLTTSKRAVLQHVLWRSLCKAPERFSNRRFRVVARPTKFSQT